ncbi:MAG: dockerin type I domain-containing protein [bacterium]
MTRVITLTTTLIVAAMVMATPVVAGVPQTINYQGQLTNSSGDPLDTTVSMDFTIYIDSTSGTSKWSELHTSVTVVSGIFSVLLGATYPIDDSVFNQPNRWLGIKVGSDPELIPRTRLTSSPYSIRVSTVDSASGGTIIGPMAVVDTTSIKSDESDRHAGWATLDVMAVGGATFHVRDGVGPAANIVFDVDGPSGRVGIGTNSAAANLHDSGSIYTLGGAGDANDDLSVGIADMVLMLNYLLGNVYLTTTGYAEADLDGDGRVTWDDYTILSEIIYSAATKDDAWRDVHSLYGAIAKDVFYVTGKTGLGTQTPAANLHDSGSIYTLGGDGDANDDDLTNLTDYIAIKAYLYEIAYLSTTGYAEADMDGDGRVTWEDATILYEMIIGGSTRDQAWRKAHSVYGTAAEGVFYVSGKTGLGTEAPAAKLHDSGSIYTLGGAGDANDDQSVNISDLLLMMNYLSGSVYLTTTGYAEADLDGDGRVTWDDYTILYEIIYSAASKDDAWRSTHSLYGAFSKNVFYVTDTVGIGTSTPTERLDVDGTARLRNMPSGTGTNVVVDGNGVLLRASSSARYKKNIGALDMEPEDALELRPVMFEWKSTGESDIGLVAEQVAQVIPELVIYDNNGQPDAVKYDRVPLYLLETVRHQSRLIEKLRKDMVGLAVRKHAAVESLESELAELHRLRESDNAKIDSLGSQLAQMQALVETILAQQNRTSGGNSELAQNR